VLKRAGLKFLVILLGTRKCFLRPGRDCKGGDIGFGVELLGLGGFLEEEAKFLSRLPVGRAHVRVGGEGRGGKLVNGQLFLKLEGLMPAHGREVKRPLVSVLGVVLVLAQHMRLQRHLFVWGFGARVQTLPSLVELLHSRNFL
jgi:hypothetical protein